MKIIGEIKGGFILQATTNEVDRVAGFARKGQKWNEGDEIDVGVIYNAITDIVAGKETLKQQAQSLRAIASQLEAIENSNPVKGKK
jgi:CheY-specific phosphatase CheX